MLAAALALAVMATAPCTSVGGRAVAPKEAQARVEQVRAMLVRERDAFELWQATWVAGLSWAAAGQASWANFSMERGGRAALLVGTLKASVGVVAVATMPDAELPGAWGGDVCDQLHAAEAALLDLADAQAAGRALWRHAGSILLNLAATLFVGLAYDDWVSAATSGVLGVAVGQVILHTRPDGAIAAGEEATVSATVGAGGVGLVVRF